MLSAVLAAAVTAACNDITPALDVTVTGVSPASGPLAGGTSVTITGTSFINVESVTVGGNELGSRTVVSATEITGTTPASTSRAGTSWRCGRIGEQLTRLLPVNNIRRVLDGSNYYVRNARGESRTLTGSPDGTKIAFSSDRDGNFQIYVMNADGSAPTRLTDNTAHDGAPAWSPTR